MIDLDREWRVIVQGITGHQGQFHTEKMLDFGTNIVAGTSPNKSGAKIHGVPVFNSVSNAIAQIGTVDANVIFVPAQSVKTAALEAIEAGVKLIVIVTEGMPVHDFICFKRAANLRKAVVIGPNCPGILSAKNSLGIIPADVFTPGKVAVISRSGTLTYEVANGLSRAGIGQRAIVGIGGDPVRGTSFIEWLKFFEQDSATDAIVLIGEIGGQSEQMAAKFIAKCVTKPIFAFISGRYAPPNKQLGHAGAIIGTNDETAGAKIRALSNVATVAETLDELVAKIAE